MQRGVGILLQLQAFSHERIRSHERGLFLVHYGHLQLGTAQ
ncbi:hypothetical protein [Endozoicomonas sp. 4G]|nr:hypothetical protein [Endozoicomonas sp. 4G]